MRCRLLQNAFIRRFKQEMDWAIGNHFFVVGSPRSARWIHRLMHDPQLDADVERTRREIWRRLRSYLIWIFGFPILVIAVAALLIATGPIRS